MSLFFQLIIAHFLCDYPLQGDFIAKFKNPNIASPVKPEVIWWQLLTAHSAIHSGAVWYLTGSPTLAAAECIHHWVTDYLKCQGCFGFHVDQLFHAFSKAAWAFIAWKWMT